MSTDSNPTGTPQRRRQGLIFGFVLGCALTAVAMGFLWSSDSTRQEDTISALSSQISEKDATISTLSSQLSERDKASGAAASEGKPPGAQP